MKSELIRLSSFRFIWEIDLASLLGRQSLKQQRRPEFQFKIPNIIALPSLGVTLRQHKPFYNQLRIVH